MTRPPTAEVLDIRAGRATIRCPYCGGEHVHETTRPGSTEHRAPGCGLYRSGADRATGYLFTTPPRRNG